MVNNEQNIEISIRVVGEWVQLIKESRDMHNKDKKGFSYGFSNFPVNAAVIEYRSRIFGTRESDCKIALKTLKIEHRHDNISN